jgi:hypothetical protein
MEDFWQTARDATLRPLLPSVEQPVDTIEVQEDVHLPETLRLLEFLE